MKYLGIIFVAAVFGIICGETGRLIVDFVLLKTPTLDSMDIRFLMLCGAWGAGWAIVGIFKFAI